MKNTSNDIKIKTALVRQSLIDRYRNREIDMITLEACEAALILEDEPENYHQANAVRQAINFIKNQ